MGSSGFIGSAAVVALIGGLTALAFVRLTGIVLLGSPRSQAAQNAHEQQGVICSGEPAGKGVGQVQVGPGLLTDLNCRRDFLRL